MFLGISLYLFLCDIRLSAKFQIFCLLCAQKLQNTFEYLYILPAAQIQFLQPGNRFLQRMRQFLQLILGKFYIVTAIMAFQPSCPQTHL